MAVAPTSLRFDEPVLKQLKATAKQRAATPSALAARLVDEGLRSMEFDGVIFRDGPTGRRAGIISGPDIWEIISAFMNSGLKGNEAITEIAGEFDLPVNRVLNSLAYYGKYATEIDQEISENEQAAEMAYQSWLNQQRVLA